MICDYDVKEIGWFLGNGNVFIEKRKETSNMVITNRNCDRLMCVWVGSHLAYFSMVHSKATLCCFSIFNYSPWFLGIESILFGIQTCTKKREQKWVTNCLWSLVASEWFAFNENVLPFAVLSPSQFLHSWCFLTS